MTSSTNNQVALVLDVGTTNIKIFVFTSSLEITFEQEMPISTTRARKDWSEQNPDEIFAICVKLIKEASAHCAGTVSFGISNQRESVVAWDKKSGEALSSLILWSDKRTRSYCDHLKARGAEKLIRQKTGLFLTPYSSAPKLNWLLQQEGVKNCKSLALGTLDTWLIYKFTGNQYTDFTNACRTMLYNVQSKRWDDSLLELFEIPLELMPRVLAPKSEFGVLVIPGLPELHITALIGDQQASLFAAGTSPGTTKVTYGTGIFPMKLIGEDYVLKHDCVTTLGIGKDNEPVYVYETKVENAAARVNEVFGHDKLAFENLMLELAQETAPALASLIDTPGKTVFVDGGISQNDLILAEQERLNTITIQRLSTYNGAALGVAKLLLEKVGVNAG